MKGFSVKEMVDYGVLGFLGMLSVIVVAIAIERIWFFATVSVDNYNDRRFLELDLHKRLTLIATIGSNAPYIGLLGTVAGIMITFVEIGANSLVDTGAIMTGLSLALKATAAGLIVAIPSIVTYNLLTRKADVVLTLWDIHHKPYTEPPRVATTRPMSSAQVAQAQQVVAQQSQISQIQRQAQMQSQIQGQAGRTTQNPQPATTQQSTQNLRPQSSTLGAGSTTNPPRV